MADPGLPWPADKISLGKLDVLLTFKTKAGEFETKDIKEMLKYLEDVGLTGRIPWKEVRYAGGHTKAKAIVIDAANQMQGKDNIVQAFLQYSGENIIKVNYDPAQDGAGPLMVKKEDNATKFPVVVKLRYTKKGKLVEFGTSSDDDTA